MLNKKDELEEQIEKIESKASNYITICFLEKKTRESLYEKFPISFFSSVLDRGLHIEKSKEEISMMERETKVFLYGMYLDMYLWNKPHYRAPSYRHDLVATFANTAVPGTGIISY